MRKLYIKRQRALFCFGTAYHAVLNQSMEDHFQWAEQQDRQWLMTFLDERALGNGAVIALEIGEAAGTVFVAAYLEAKILNSKLFRAKNPSMIAITTHCVQ